MLACWSLVEGWGNRDEHVCHVEPQTVSLIIKAVETLDYLLVLLPHVAGPMEVRLPGFEPGLGLESTLIPHRCALSYFLSLLHRAHPVIKR